MFPVAEFRFSGVYSASNKVVIIPFQRKIVASAVDGSITLWNWGQSTKHSYELFKHAGASLSLASMHSGPLCASGGQNGDLCLWKASLAGKPQVVKAHCGPVRTVCFSQCNRWLISGSDDKTIKVWDVQKRCLMQCLQSHRNWVYGAQFAANNRIVSCSDDCTVKLWDVKSGQLLDSFKGFHAGVRALSVNVNGFCVAAGGVGKSIKLWDLRSCKMIQHYDAHDDCINDLHFHGSSFYILSVSSDTTARVWDLREGRPVYTLRAHSRPVTGCSVTDSHFATCSAANITLWSWNLGRLKYEENETK